MTQLCWYRMLEIFEAYRFETLTISNSDPRQETHHDLMKALIKLPENSLLELNLSNINIELIIKFFLRQQSIKYLTITGALGESTTFINGLNLTKLKLVGPKTKKLVEIIKSQPNLTTLKITTDKETDYDEIVFQEIVKLNKLESLDVPFLRNFTIKNIKSLNHLRNLKKLSVSCNDSCLQSLIATSIPSLQELDINFEDLTPVNFVENLSRNIPNLKSIKFRGALVANFLNEIPAHYQNLESLWLINVESYFVNIFNLRTADAVNLNLKHLFIINHDRKFVICTNDLIRFIKMFPNIETLVVTKFIEIQLKDFETILKNLPNLQEIVIDSKSIESTIKVMSMIGVHGKSLKYVKFENFKHSSNKDSLKVFFDGKFSVYEKIDGNLILRQNKKSYLSRVLD
jgi:hypothetical protein